jgi:hypothetical protein
VAPDLRVVPLRYEDTHERPEEAFTVVRFSELADQIARIREAIKFSRYEELKAREEATGFHEKMPRTRSFIRRGETSSWRERPGVEQAPRIVADHGQVPRRFGYLDENGAPRR